MIGEYPGEKFAVGSKGNQPKFPARHFPENTENGTRARFDDMELMLTPLWWFRPRVFL
jgi:hypothetical protein